eukprot:TRINITY_DN424_c0_g1_i4.p1 TRINITY_DN424_c0_g1~~TRINITY_DN424_c0_g1_i4.p1  ORF type:complete len:215 (-),score=33.85 TRINITY_DN424_c0_g1_i4:531-1154(-)
MGGGGWRLAVYEVRSLVDIYVKASDQVGICPTGYVPIRTSEECENAAEYLGENDLSVELWDAFGINIPSGCWFYNDELRFNNDPANWDFNGNNGHVFVLCMHESEMSDKYHLAPPGAGTCDYGETVSSEDCEAVSAMLVTGPIGAPIQRGSGGSCGDGAWGNVPPGCSAQSGGGNAAHYQSIDLQCDSYHGITTTVCENKYVIGHYE